SSPICSEGKSSSKANREKGPRSLSLFPPRVKGSSRRQPCSSVSEFLSEAVFFYLLIERALCDTELLGGLSEISAACVNCRLDGVALSTFQRCKDVPESVLIDSPMVIEDTNSAGRSTMVTVFLVPISTTRLSTMLHSFLILPGQLYSLNIAGVCFRRW